MFKKLLLTLALVGTLTLGSCTYLQDTYEKPSCEESVAIAVHAVTLASIEVTEASQENLIPVDKRAATLDAIDAAYDIAERAGSFCPISEKTTADYLALTYTAIDKIIETIGE